jgi:hypothetical protein
MWLLLRTPVPALQHSSTPPPRPPASFAFSPAAMHFLDHLFQMLPRLVDLLSLGER